MTKKITNLMIERMRKDALRRHDIKPRDLLKRVDADLAEGKVKADGCLVILVDRKEDTSQMYFCQMTDEQAVSELAIQQFLIMKQMLGKD